MPSLTDLERNNYSILRDCLASPLIARSAPKASNEHGRRRKTKAGRKTTASQPSRFNVALEEETSDAEELADFIDYIATEIFAVLPLELQTLSHEAVKTNTHLATRYADPLPTPTASSLLASIPASVPDSLSAYGFLDLTRTDLSYFLIPIFESYISTTTTPPPPLQTTQRGSACEICERDWVPLTYHHLIPRSTHEKVVKRGWHEEWRLQSVAWLCRACHSFVHGVGSNEELAREWWSVDLLLGREDVQRWKGWVGRVRWRSR